jgi:hypothetical protein
MIKHKVRNILIYKSDFNDEAKYKQDLSEKLLSKYGIGPYSEYGIVREVINYAYEYYCDTFVRICHSETSVLFYQFVLSQHEQVTELVIKREVFISLDKSIGDYVAVYRRILKWILEQACDINLHDKEHPDEEFYKRSETLLNELVIVGNLIVDITHVYAEQDLIEDAIEVVYDSKKIYSIQRKHHYDFMFSEINKTRHFVTKKWISEKNGMENLLNQIMASFGVRYEDFAKTINSIHNNSFRLSNISQNFSLTSIIENLVSDYKLDRSLTQSFLQGIVLTRDNKLCLSDVACKSQNMNRYLYRPLTIWNVNGKDIVFTGRFGFSESFLQLVQNGIPWGKAPNEWMSIKSFQSYVRLKEIEHFKWLEDEVEKELASENLTFYRNIKSISTLYGSQSLLVKNVGEIDFIIICHDKEKIIVVDCKSLQTKNDLMSQKFDLKKFTEENGYNTNMQNKVKWVMDNKINLDYHNKSVHGTSEKSIANYRVEGVFVIDTPTFYMYNSEIRIYTIDKFVPMITERLRDTEYTHIVENQNNITIYTIKHPYFKKPNNSNLKVIHIPD